MENQYYLEDELPEQAIFALDIGTRSIIGMVGIPDDDKIQIVAIERVEHTQRAMIDGQIENIDQVAKIAGMVKSRLEKKLGCRLTRVAVAAAGRALRTESVTSEIELPEVQRIDAEIVSRLEAQAISEAEKSFAGEEETEGGRRFYLVGYSVSRYYLDNYVISSLIDHHGRLLKADLIATFLPSEVVESLYATMHKIGLEVASLTLEPIAAINAAIPPSIRLLNLAMVDIGAGTSDIAVCRDGSITGYTMAVQAGDEITETVMKEYLVDFQTAERIKYELNAAEQIVFTDIMGFEQTVTRDQLSECIKDTSSRLCEEICSKIIEANGGMPSAVFLAGGGSQLAGLKEGIVEKLNIDPKRVAIAGRNFKANAYSEEYDLENPEYATPLGILISAGLNMINDSFRVILNGHPAKLFRSGIFTVMNILMMNGFSFQDLIGKSGQNLVVQFNGERKVFYGEKAEPGILKLNGKDTQLSGLVRAGDHVDFVPARHGKDASAMLSQLVSLDEGYDILVNGETVTGDVVLHSGDVISVEGMEDDMLQEEDFVLQTAKEHEPDPTASEEIWIQGHREEGADPVALDHFGMINPEAAQEETSPSLETGPNSDSGNSSGESQAAQEKEAALPEAPGGGSDALSTEKKKRTPAAKKKTSPSAAEKKKRVSSASTRKKKSPAAAVSDETETPVTGVSESAAAGKRKRSETLSAGRRDRMDALLAGIMKNPETAEGERTETPEGREESAAMTAEAGEKKAVMDGGAGEASVIFEEGSSQTQDMEAEPRTADGDAEEQKVSANRSLMIYLNDRNLFLPPKEDGSPYYLMDMLQYSGLDLKKVTYPVTLEVNNKSASFQQELKTGDQVRIYEQRPEW